MHENSAFVLVHLNSGGDHIQTVYCKGLTLAIVTPILVKVQFRYAVNFNTGNREPTNTRNNLGCPSKAPASFHQRV